MGPEDRHEEPAEQDGYEKWLEEVTRKRETAELAKLIKPEYSQSSELDADQYDAELRKKRREASLDRAWEDLGNTLREMGKEEPGW